MKPLDQKVSNTRWRDRRVESVYRKKSVGSWEEDRSGPSGAERAMAATCVAAPFRLLPVPKPHPAVPHHFSYGGSGGCRCPLAHHIQKRCPSSITHRSAGDSTHHSREKQTRCVIRAPILFASANQSSALSLCFWES